METPVSKLEAAMELVQADLSDIKATLRIHDAKFDSLRDRIESMRDPIDGMRDRMDAVRDRMDGLRDRMERDFRVLFGALIAVTLGLAGLMAKGFHWL